MAQMMNPAIERALTQAAQMTDHSTSAGAGQPLGFLTRPSDAVIDRIMNETQAKPLALGLKQQLTQAMARLRGLIEPEERRAQMRLVADLQTRLGLEMNVMQKYG